MYSRCESPRHGWLYPYRRQEKTSYLSDKRFFEHMGFTLQDEADPYFQLMALTWNGLAASSAFKDHVKSDSVNEKGITIYYTAQCPFAVGMINDLRELTEKKGVQIQSIHLSSKEEAQKSPAIWTTFSVFLMGDL